MKETKTVVQIVEAGFDMYDKNGEALLLDASQSNISQIDY